MKSTPVRASSPRSKGRPRAGWLVEGSGEGAPLSGRVRDAQRHCPRAGDAGPRLVHTPSEPSGSQRSPAVSSGRSFAQVARAILGK
jgi:hypothetical protein